MDDECTRYRLPRQVFTQEIQEIISREMKKQDIDLAPLPKKNLKELVEVSKIILEKGVPDHLVVKKLSSKLGYGVFLHPDADPITIGSLIAPYSGEVNMAPQNEPDDSAYAFAAISDILLKKEEHPLIDQTRKYHPNRHYVLNLDAKDRGNFTRFINHSIQPNIEAEFFKVSKNALGLKKSPIEVFYRASKKIMPGEQLLVCYEDEEETYWKPFNIKPFPMTPQTFTLDDKLNIIKSDR